MLNPHTNRRPVSRLPPACGDRRLLARRAADRRGVAVTATPSGTVSDPSGLPLPNATVRLAAVTAERRSKRTTDARGVPVSAVPAGDYMLSSRYPGFSRSASVCRSPAPRRFPAWRWERCGNSHREGQQGRPTVADVANATKSPTAAPLPMPAAPACGSTSVGGNLKPPRKLFDVRPRYRQAWFDAGSKATSCCRRGLARMAG